MFDVNSRFVTSETLTFHPCSHLSHNAAAPPALQAEKTIGVLKVAPRGFQFARQGFHRALNFNVGEAARLEIPQFFLRQCDDPSDLLLKLGLRSQCSGNRLGHIDGDHDATERSKNAQCRALAFLI